MLLSRLWKSNVAFWNQERSIKALLFYLFISIISWLPLSEKNPIEEALQDLVFNLIVLAGYFSAAVDASIRKTQMRKMLLVLALAASFFRTLEYFINDQQLQWIDMAVSTTYFSLLSYLIFIYVVRDDREVTTHRVRGAIVVYILVGLICSFFYNLVYLSDQSAFLFTSKEEIDVMYSLFVYFSFVVQTTVGAGDIIPVSAAAKSVVIFQSSFGMLYPVVIIARLVTLEIEHTRLRRQNGNNHGQSSERNQQS